MKPSCNDPTGQWQEAGWVTPDYTFRCVYNYSWGNSTGDTSFTCPDARQTKGVSSPCTASTVCYSSIPGCCTESCSSWSYDPDTYMDYCSSMGCDMLLTEMTYDCSVNCNLTLDNVCSNSSATSNPWYAVPPGGGGKCVMAPQYCPGNWTVYTSETISNILVPFNNYANPTSTITRPLLCGKPYNPSTLGTCPTGWTALFKSTVGAVCF